MTLLIIILVLLLHTIPMIINFGVSCVVCDNSSKTFYFTVIPLLNLWGLYRSIKIIKIYRRM